MNTTFRNKTNQKLLHGAIFAFLITLAIYFYINITIVYGVIQHKNLNLSISKINKEMLQTESDINVIHNSLGVENLSDYKLLASKQSEVFLSKDLLSSFSLSYGKTDR